VCHFDRYIIIYIHHSDFLVSNTYHIQQLPLSKLEVVTEEALDGVSSCFDFKSFFTSAKIIKKILSLFFYKNHNKYSVKTNLL